MTQTIDPGHLYDQQEWSHQTFGPGFRPGVFRHLEKEVKEAEKKPDDITEWADLLILTFDGALRAGHTPASIIATYHAKRRENENRQWPDLRTLSPDEAIEHVRDEGPREADAPTSFDALLKDAYLAGHTDAQVDQDPESGFKAWREELAR